MDMKIRNLNIHNYVYLSDCSRLTLIQNLIDNNEYKSYLEIGVDNGLVFNNIRCDEKVGVDPCKESAATIKITSDDYFAHIQDDKKFDVIFIDGLHEYHQCYRDIINAIRHLSPNGTIVCHDMNPLEEAWIHNGDVTSGRWCGVWTGDVFKAFVELRCTRSDVETTLLYDLDMGCGIIRFRQLGHPVINKDDYNFETYDDIGYNYWEQHKQELMGCMNYNEFEENFILCDYFEHTFQEII